MRSAVTMAALALFVAACGSTTTPSGTTTGATGEATTGGATGGSGSSGGETAGSSSGGTTTGSSYVDAGLVDGTACTANLACASHVCGLSGSGNCCSIACTSTNATCAATGCDDKGTCQYPSMAAMGGAAPACGGTCTKGLLDAFFCDTSGNCSVSTGQAFPCPNSFGCDSKGEACNTSCATDADCFAGAFCLDSVCAPRNTTGPCVENDGCVSQICDIAGSGNCCNAACAATKDPACAATTCDVNSGACVYPVQPPRTCGQNLCSNSLFTVPGDGTCDATGACIDTAKPCPSNLGCNAAGTACNTTCSMRTDCASGFYCSNSQCVPELALGACTENPECVSDFCGTTGTGNCCAAACAATADPKCDPINCDATAGGCVYPAGFACGAATCTNNVLTFACDNTGACQPNTTSAVCGGNLTCNAAGTDCNATCTTDTDCVSGYYCFAGACNLRLATGPCPINDGCTSGVCGGATGSGDCCAAACPDTVAACAATNCDAKTGACIYPSASTACGTILASCTNGVEDDPSVCDGAGNCPTPGVSVCAPYICDSTTNACFTSCSDATSCATGDFCDPYESTCCAGLTTGGTINVDGKKGKDAACCGVNGNTPCLTIGRAMGLIDGAQAQGVTINAYINGMGGGGNWTAKGESYPITLGWGAELSAPGVYFYYGKTAAEIFDIDNYSTNDKVGYASIVGNGNPVYIGWDQNGDQPDATSSIQVEASNTLYIANATVNGSQNNMTAAITVAAGGTLMLGQDQSAGVTGTVNIGQSGQNGWNGIVCQTDSVSLGCTITDANLNGTTAVDIQYQANQDIDAEDFASISLTSNPVVGSSPNGSGFGTCGSKPDCASSSKYPNGAAILLNGDVTMTYSNGTVQCISGYGFLMQATKEGTPTLTMDSSTLQNTEWAIYATAGTATVSNSTIQYNYNGVQQGTDGNNVSSILLNGGTVGGTNTLACFSDSESVDQTNVGVGVFNSTNAVLKADNCNWDTSGPDLFSCTNDTFNSCTCQLASCTTAASADGMDAVYDSTGTITTTGNGSATQSCVPSCGGMACSGGDICCTQWLSYGYGGCCAPAGNTPYGDSWCDWNCGD